LPEKFRSQAERCVGVEMLEPHHWFNGSRMIWSYELNPKMTDMDELCDSEIQMRNTDPRILYDGSDNHKQNQIQESIDE
tara:strand:- start:122 stop:358 length:237 start_codon:yes stop_codon:yes gene_type:complete